MVYPPHARLVVIGSQNTTAKLVCCPYALSYYLLWGISVALNVRRYRRRSVPLDTALMLETSMNPCRGPRIIHLDRR
ncbi:hypothetical protein BJX66DRAFT_318427 [Aspergillus keveii]|uniref:Uncharacterized protein n=1 Tax=Aspergillus keveii TaxID=714993 RepID=A0ABR4FJU1_9EURO